MGTQPIKRLSHLLIKFQKQNAINMKQIYLFVLTFLSVTFSLAQNLPQQEISSDIHSLTVFLNNAEITRKQTVQIPAGKSDVVFTNISSRILLDGIKVSASGDVKVYAVNIESNEVGLKSRPEYLKISKEQEAAFKKFELQKSRVSIIEEEIFYLKQNMNVGGETPASFSRIDEGQIYFRKKLEELSKQLIEEKIKQDQEGKIFQDANKLYNKKMAQLKKITSAIRLTLLSSAATSTEIELAYLVTNALWKPHYSIRATRENPEVQIEYQAQIYNDTGNDWDNKPMTLAIVDATHDITKPALQTWVLDGNKRGNFLYKSVRRKELRQSSKQEENLNDDVIELDDLSTRFELKDLHFIPSDAVPHLVDIAAYEKEAFYYTLSIPKIKNGAFLIAGIPDWESLGLIDGKASLYYNETYQGSTILKTQQINDTLDISLGLDNTYEIARKKVSQKSRKNLIGFNIKEKLTFEILVKNKKTTSATIQVKDQIPVSISKDIEVKSIELSGGKVDPLTGEVTWDLELDPGEVRKIILSMTIKYPKSKQGSMFYNNRAIYTPRYF